MNPGFLALKPTHWLCPRCQEWHEWTSDKKLGDFKFKDCTAKLTCVNKWYEKCESSCYEFSILKEQGIFYRVGWTSGKLNFGVLGCIPIFDIAENDKEAIVTFRAQNGQNIKYGEITLGFKFNQSEYDKIVKGAQLASEEAVQVEVQQRAKKIIQQKINEALATEKKTQTRRRKKGTDLSKNL